MKSLDMKKSLHFILPVFIFFPAFLYLHQKIQIYVEAYYLSSSYYRHNELLDKRDCLMYNFAKEVSLAKVNQWAQVQRFGSVDKAKVLALDIQEQKQIVSAFKPEVNNKMAMLLKRFLKGHVPVSTALAKE
ncbi:MAG: hypothetical protein ABIH08_01600 [Candidatus Omnitrophota bacterium]